MTSRNFLLVLFSLILSVSTLGANSIFDALQQSAGAADAPLTVKLELPLDSIYAKSVQEQAAWFTYTDNTGLAQRWPLHVDVRGKFRRRICTFPPLKLNFSKKELKSRGFTKHDKLKLVTPCANDDESQELVLKEFLAYQLYQQLSPNSFRVQLLEITYQDVNGNHPDQTSYAFVLEDADEMAERLGGKEIDDARGLPPMSFDRKAETDQALFSYFIGNTDWNLSMSRNLKMVELENGRVVPIPYDFDFSALVDAPYALPSNALGQFTVEQRIYLGFAVEDDILSAALTNYIEQRKVLNQMVRQFKLISSFERNRIIVYLDSFYSESKRLLKEEGEEQSLFVLLRGNQPDLVPPGADPAYYGVSRK